uniref:Uncharacterized protein n=1 Tax=Neobodo designis TaxID=312471 RepID=A0A7S1L009_NEODS|mmetsp:Transcript_12220/g.38032  ORF Transcript_12220/g.38032 Transcript_12220/m.38032 type:complete len:132 (+) Transcript_12220:146-541(+)
MRRVLRTMIAAGAHRRPRALTCPSCTFFRMISSLLACVFLVCHVPCFALRPFQKHTHTHTWLCSTFRRTVLRTNYITNNNNNININNINTRRLQRSWSIPTPTRRCARSRLHLDRALRCGVLDGLWSADLK